MPDYTPDTGERQPRMHETRSRRDELPLLLAWLTSFCGFEVCRLFSEWY